MNARQLRAVKSNVKWKVKAKPYGGKRQALTQDELDRLFAALKGNRHGHRDWDCQIFCVRDFCEGGIVVGPGISRTPPSIPWWPTLAVQQALSRPKAGAEGPPLQSLLVGHTRRRRV